MINVNTSFYFTTNNNDIVRVIYDESTKTFMISVGETEDEMFCTTLTIEEFDIYIDNLRKLKNLVILK